MFKEIYGINIGIVAVINFLILSGFVITHSIKNYYPDKKYIGNFYLDRAIRIYPQFLLISSLTAFLAWKFNLHHFWLNPPPPEGIKLSEFMMQLFIIPLNFYREISHMYLPQAWYLGLEIMFYLSFPFIYFWVKKKIVVALASFVIFLIAMSGMIDLDLYGFRYLPGTLFIFLIGSFIYNPINKYEVKFPLLVLIIVFFLLIARPLLENIFKLNESEVIIQNSIYVGLISGIAINIFISRIILTKKSMKDLSYGIFINHNLIIAVLISYYGVYLPDFDNLYSQKNQMLLFFW